MKLTREQDQYLNQYLKSVGIKFQEPFEEFYDHIATAFEKSESNELKSFIHQVVEPSFGGITGIKKTLKQQSKSLTQYYRHKLWQQMVSFLKWPLLPLSASMYALLFLLFHAFPTKGLLALIFCLTVSTPFLVVLYGLAKFSIHCKRNGTPFKGSLKNQELHRLSLFGLLLMSLYNLFFADLTSDIVNPFISEWIGLVTLGLFFLIIYTISLVQILRQALDFKLQLS